MKCAALYQKAASGLQGAQEGERRAYGFDSRMQEQETQVDPAELKRQYELIDSILAYVDLIKALEHEDQKRQKAKAAGAHDG
jgi:hypothetical protein